MLSIRVQNNLLELYKSKKLYGNISSEIKQEGSYFNPKLAAVKARKILLSVGLLSSFLGVRHTLGLYAVDDFQRRHLIFQTVSSFGFLETLH